MLAKSLKLSSFAVLLLSVFGVSTALAQIDRGSIVGIVRDSTGAAVAKAAVRVHNNATGEDFPTVTNDAGEYQVPALIPGTYAVNVSAPGFASQLQDHIIIDVQSRPSVDFTLQVGQVSQVLEVQSTSPLLQTETADVGGVVQEKQIVDLPLNGRRYSDLALLEPGIQRNYWNQNNTAPDRFSSNGNSETQNYFALDGVDNNSGSTNLQESSTQAVQPPPDALQEFRVQTRTYSAEFGLSAGAVINASIKSGTNQFHGDVWEFIRNSDLDANRFENNANGVPIGQYSQNQFGGTIGGPIIKNRTFFFGDAQGFISRQATSIDSVVPTPLMKQGNFTELPNQLTSPQVAGQAGCISNNIIAANCIDPVGQKLLGLFPDPNIPSAVAREGQPGSWTGGPNYQYLYSIPNDTHTWDLRIDHAFNDTNRMFGRFSDYTVDRQDAPWTGDPVAGNGDFATQYRIRGKSVALALNQNFGSSILNEIRGGFNRDNAHSDPIGLALGNSLASQYGLTGIPSGPNDAGIPPINISGLQRLGSSPWRPQYQVSQVWQLIDTLSWLKGGHSFRFGYEYRHSSDNFLDIESPQGQISTTGIYTGNTGTGIPDFLLGDVSSALFTTPTVVHNYLIGNSFFAMDTWRVTPKLTLTYGLRYELFSPILNHQNAVSNFTGANGGGLVTATDGDWYQRALVHPDQNDFAPRVGFSWHPLSHMVVRGGYGTFYQHTVRIGSESILALNPPFLLDLSLSQAPGSTTPVFQLKNGFPASEFNASLVQLDELHIRAQDPNERTGYVHQTSFGTEFELSRSTVLDTDYVGNFGRKMNRLRDANQGMISGYDAAGNPIITYQYPNLNNVAAGQHAFLELATNDGNTNYNALLVSLRKRFGHGISYGISYTWSHAISDFVDNLTGTAFPQNTYDYAAERSNSPFDVRHRFVANGNFELPFGRNKPWLSQGLASKVAGGWQVNAIVTLQTGTPFTITAPDESETGGNHMSRANCIGDAFSGSTSDPSKYFGNGSGFFLNPAAFAIPAVGMFGNCAPRSYYGPGLENTDLSLFRTFSVTERFRLEFRSEFFNALNHANFQNPNSDISPSNLGSFGKTFSTITDPREIQFALKLYF